MKLWVIVAAVAAAIINLPTSTAKTEKDDHKFSSQISTKDVSPNEYNFIYGVSDPFASSLFGHQEFSDGKTISGSYHVRLPDGRHQTVIYQDDGTGFVADVSYDPIARHPDFSLYFESTQEPTPSSSAFSSKENHREYTLLSTTPITSPTLNTSIEPIRLSRELEPPSKEKTQDTLFSSINVRTLASIMLRLPKIGHNNSTVTPTLSIQPAPEIQPFIQNSSLGLTSSTSTQAINSTEVPTFALKEIRLINNPSKFNSRELELTKESSVTEVVTSDEAQFKTVTNKAKTKIITNSTKSLTTQTKLTNKQRGGIQTANTITTKRPAVTPKSALLVIDFEETLFREDFPTPVNSVIATTEKPANQLPNKAADVMNKQTSKQTTLKPATSSKKESNFKLTNATSTEEKKKQNSNPIAAEKQPLNSNMVKLVPAAGTKINLANESLTEKAKTSENAQLDLLLKHSNVTEDKVNLNTTLKEVKASTVKQVSATRPSTSKPTVPLSTREPIESGTPLKQKVAKPLRQSSPSPTFGLSTERPLSIFELLDKFKPLSFRTPTLTHRQSHRTKRSDNEPPKIIITNLFKNLPGINMNTENSKIEERIQTLKEVKNDPVFKNFIQAQRYRMVLATLPPIKKAPNHIKLIHIKHAIKHIPQYEPPPTTQPSAYAKKIKHRFNQ